MKFVIFNEVARLQEPPSSLADIYTIEFKLIYYEIHIKNINL